MLNDIDLVRASIHASLQDTQSVVRALIQEKVSEIAVKFGLHYTETERACQELCARRADTVNQTLAALCSGEPEIQQEFFLILVQQREQE